MSDKAVVEAIEDGELTGTTVCGIPNEQLLEFANLLPEGRAQTMWKKFRSTLFAYRALFHNMDMNNRALVTKLKRARAAAGGEGEQIDPEIEAKLKTRFAEIDAEGLDEAKTARAKAKACAALIDPVKFYNSLSRGLDAGDAFARKTYTDIMGMTVDAKATALDDRPPGFQFTYSDRTEDDPEEETEKPPAATPDLRIG